MTARVLFVIFAVAASACGAPLEPELDFPEPSAELPPEPPPPPPPEPAVASTGTLLRSDVNALLDAGFARFLQQVDVEPALENGRFRGWRVLALRPESFWATVDLRPGDVVVSVNGMPIERETEAFAAFESLRTADRLSVAYVRGREPRSLEYRIVADAPAGGKAEPATPKR